MAKTIKEEKAAKQVKEKGKKKGKSTAPQGSIQRFRIFVKESWNELKKVHWPTPKQAINESIVVLVTVFFLVFLVIIYDKISIFLLSFILK